MDTLGEWQHLDTECNTCGLKSASVLTCCGHVKLIYPWYTSPFLNELNGWKKKSPIDIKMSEWTVFEWGSGNSTLWWKKHCKNIVSIDDNLTWVDFLAKKINSDPDTNCLSIKKSNNYNFDRCILKHRTGDSSATIGTADSKCTYVQSINENSEEKDSIPYNCVIIDGSFGRNTCAFELMKRDQNNKLIHLTIPSIVILDNADQGTIHLSSKETFELMKDYKMYSFKEPKHQDWTTVYWIVDK